MVRTKVFVGNLSFKTKEAGLAAEFAVAGKVISANIITRGPRSLGYGFVEMDSEEMAEKAVQLLNKKEIDGRMINVEVAKPRQELPEKKPAAPAAANPAPATTQAAPKNTEAKPRAPRVRKPRVEGQGQNGTAKPSNGFSKPVKKFQPRNPNPAGTADQAAKTEQPARVPKENQPERVPSQQTLFVANLPFSFDDAAFAKVFEDLSLKCTKAHVVKKRNGRSKGFGFVTFDTEDTQKKALDAVNNKQVEGRELIVKIALTEQENGEVAQAQVTAEQK